MAGDMDRFWKRWICAGVAMKALGLGAFGAEVAAPAMPAGAGVPSVHVLKADRRWLLQTPAGRYDASALLRMPDGTLLTVNDKELPLCRLRLGTGETARVVPESAMFPVEAVRAASASPRYIPDIEGIARDDAGRLYICTEGTRWIFRCAPDGGGVERLEIDWEPVRRWFAPKDGNAAWEGIAVGGDRLYLANERSTGRIVVVDLKTLRVTEDFRVAPGGYGDGDISYSDLCWFEGDLWVLCREARKVLRVEPSRRAVIAEFDFRELEGASENAYLTALPYGFAEGLAVESTHLWLAVDNNGLPRRSSPTDSRPLLLRCPRPDVPVIPSRAVPASPEP